jgi:flagellar basal body-associated protein FliL
MIEEILILKVICIVLISIIGGIFSNWLIKKSDLYKESELYKKELRYWFYEIEKFGYPTKNMEYPYNPEKSQ